MKSVTLTGLWKEERNDTDSERRKVIAKGRERMFFTDVGSIPFKKEERTE